MQRFLLLLFCSFMAHHALIAQEPFNPIVVETYQQAEQALLDGKVPQALRLFEKTLKMQPDMSAAKRGMGICYELMKDYPKAAELYQSVLASDSMFSRVLYFQTGEALFKAGKPEEALGYFQQYKDFLSIEADTFSMNSAREIEMEDKKRSKLDANIRACEISLDSSTFINVNEVVNLGSAINSVNDDYFPFLTNDQQTLYFTRKTPKGEEDLYLGKRSAGEWNGVVPVRAINSSENEGMCTIVRDGRKLFFTACNREDVLGVCDIWEANVDANGKIAAPTAMSGYANSEYWESEASVSCDGSTLYFASQRPGGFGKSDIWFCTRNADGSWGQPVNLGSKINTDDYEEAPFITDDGQTLYFSSYGHPGMGEQDIFVSWKDANGEWTTPVGLGPPINTPYRELGFFLSADGRTGYFASDRPDGYGQMDIYKFQLGDDLHSQPITFVEGIVKDSVLEAPVAALVAIEGRNAINTASDGRFFLCVPAGDTLDIRVNKPYFHAYNNAFTIPRWENKQFYTIEILLRSTFDDLPPPEAPKDSTDVTRPKKEKEVAYQHIMYFGFDKTTVDINELDALDAFLKPFKTRRVSRIEIIGYADDIGANSYNLKLSEARAKEIAIHLMNKGYIVDQIYLEGKGSIINDRPKDENRKVELKFTVWE
ncbi:MAG TPA: OmpA family protein [Saprospiraceae bacterium]|nr:OmpA family protein [Saprospiraceae bacterium]HMQ81739.1 OmpA family protein [Saprospiraceae bacterium]